MLDDVMQKTLKEAMKKISFDRTDLAETRLMLISAMIYHLIEEQKVEYDLIVGGGNTGKACIEIAKIVYGLSKKTIPKSIAIPVVRYRNEKLERFDNSCLLPAVSNELKDIKRLNRVLFVDDEIRIGFTAKTCIDLIGKSIGQNFQTFPVTLDIIAENHLFAWQHDMAGVCVRFFPHSFVFFGYNNNLSYLPSPEIKNKVNIFLQREVNINQLLATLLTGEIKVNTDSEAHWDKSLENDLTNKFESYKEIKANFRKYVSDLISKGIEFYKRRELKLRLYA